jgi:uncharacterized protein (TIGR03435 family)
MSIADSCKNLGWNAMDRPVIDRTGIDGIFNFHVEFTADESTPNLFDPYRPASDPGPSIFTAVLEQLGLKLEPAKGPRDFLVIDHVERPTEIDMDHVC